VPGIGFGGPGITNNINPPNIVSNAGDNHGILTIAFSTSMVDLGFGFADLALDSVADALTITLFDGVTDVGSLTYGGSPDPTFTGGFAGIQSSIAFNSAEITFDHGIAFAVDNIQGLVGLGFRLRERTA